MTRKDKPKEKPEQLDLIRREWSFSVFGTNIDSMVEKARIRAGAFFQEPLKNIQIIAGPPRVATIDEFRTDMDTPAQVDSWEIQVTAVVKEKDEEQIERAAD